MSTASKRLSYSIWIEAEQWDAGEWDPVDDNSDVVVSFEDGTSSAATFVSYRNIQSLADKNRVTGECLGGKYFWTSDLILVDEVTRARIEEVIKHLIEAGEFEGAFSRCKKSAD